MPAALYAVCVFTVALRISTACFLRDGLALLRPSRQLA